MQLKLHQNSRRTSEKLRMISVVLSFSEEEALDSESSLSKKRSSLRIYYNDISMLRKGHKNKRNTFFLINLLIRNQTTQKN